MSSGLPPVPFQNPVTDQNGNMTPGWAVWFRNIYTRVGGASASTNAELASLFPVATANIASGAVTSAQLASGAVTSSAIASGAVTSAALGSGAVTSSAIASSAVTGPAIANGSVAFVQLLASDWSNSKSSSGYMKLGSGLYLVWGATAGISSGTSSTITFIASFPTACLQVITGIQGNSSIPTSTTGQWGTSTYTATTFSLYNGTSTTLNFNYLAIGF